MEDNIPAYILKEMEQMGVLPRHPLEEVQNEPVVPRTFEYNMPELDENGEPPF